MNLNFINSIFHKCEKDCRVKGNITLSPNAYEVFRALSYEWISETSEEIRSKGIDIFYIRLRSQLPENICLDCLDILTKVGIARQNSQGHYSVTALGTRTNLYQEEGRKYLEQWDKLADEWWEEQQQLKSKGIFRENCQKTTTQSTLCQEEK